MTTFDQPAIDFDATTAPATTLVSGIGGITSTTASTPQGYHYEQGRCPNVGRACNCPGYCRPRLVKDAISGLPSEPISGETAAVVADVATDRMGSWEWDRFVEACHETAADDGQVDPGIVRSWLLSARGDLTINPRRLSAFYNRATGKNGFLDFSHWGINTDTKGRNAGRPARIYKLRNP